MAPLISFTSIGIVRNAMRESHRETRWEEIESEIVIDERWRDALAGIEEFSHLWVIVALDRMPAPSALRIRPMRRDDLANCRYFCDALAATSKSNWHLRSGIARGARKYPARARTRRAG